MINKKLDILEEMNEIHDDFISITDSISLLKTNMTQLQQNIRNLEKKANKKFKSYIREVNKHKSKGNKKPSGFAKPSNISTQLCSFLNKPNGTKMARTEVTQHLIKYISNNNLQNPENKTIINPDDRLISLLDINQENNLTYFNLQKYMNKHFI